MIIFEMNTFMVVCLLREIFLFKRNKVFVKHFPTIQYLAVKKMLSRYYRCGIDVVDAYKVLQVPSGNCRYSRCQVGTTGAD